MAPSRLFGPNPFCRCQQVGKEEFRFTFGRVLISSRAFGIHYRGCPYYQPGNQSISRRRYNVTLNTRRFSWDQAPFFSVIAALNTFLTPSLHAVRIYAENDHQAPGFDRIHNAEEKIIKCLQRDHRLIPYKPMENLSQSQLQCFQSILEDLRTNLVDDFNTNRRWERVELETGATLLHVSDMDVPMGFDQIWLTTYSPSFCLSFVNIRRKHRDIRLVLSVK